ncbi:hypothetical protein [Ralstonia syzygii]|uniref:hypothetical protein n=1 Tax=Ralstonia syzygii TaxID=28097 RepID=UPI0023DB92C3|nr:hypothetical protein [Ralstonia syzygii]
MTCLLIVVEPISAIAMPEESERISDSPQWASLHDLKLAHGGFPTDAACVKAENPRFGRYGVT